MVFNDNKNMKKVRHSYCIISCVLLILIFDVSLHFGTLIVIVAYFFKDFWNMVIKGLTKGPKDEEGKLFWQVI